MYCVCVSRCTQLTSVIKNKIKCHSQNLICHEISYLYCSKYTVFENVPLSCITNLVCKIKDQTSLAGFLHGDFQNKFFEIDSWKFLKRNTDMIVYM